LRCLYCFAQDRASGAVGLLYDAPSREPLATDGCVIVTVHKKNI
jgi:hypothetical protein